MVEAELIVAVLVRLATAGGHSVGEHGGAGGQSGRSPTATSPSSMA